VNTSENLCAPYSVHIVLRALLNSTVSTRKLFIVGIKARASSRGNTDINAPVLILIQESH
jgi:hypothetical protein